MKTIDLKEIIEKQNLDAKDIAQQLFPGNKYPKLALNRVLTGEAVLDANQISKLALLLGVTASQLYLGAEWASQSKNGIFTFTNDKFKAELNTETWVTKIFHKDSLFHESIIHSGFTPISEYITELNSIIIKYQSNDNS